MPSAFRRYGLSSFVALGFVSCTQSTGPEENLALIYIDNRTTAVIQNMFVVECMAPNWGDNRLVGGEVFEPSTIRAVAVTPGCWKARVETADDRSSEQHAIELAREGSFTWTLSSLQ